MCDDDNVMLDEICRRIKEYYTSDCEIEQFEDGKQLLEENRERLFDVLFLDIDMPGISGIEIAEDIRKDNQYVKIVFVTNKDNMVYKTIKYVPFRFIRKSYLDEEFPETAKELKKSLADSSRTEIFSLKDKKVCVKLRDIIYAEVVDHTLKVNLQNGVMNVTKTMDELDDEIGSFGFIRIHKSYLANYRYISSIETKDVVLNDGKKLPMSKKRIKDVKLQLQMFSRNER